MFQQPFISKRKEAEIQRRRAVARKKIEILNELKSFDLQVSDAPLICILPTARHSKKCRVADVPSIPRRSKFLLRQEREKRLRYKAQRNPFLLEVIYASTP
ncbi:hypothetical protein SO574_23580 (plasmid) [Vibrio alfacsensis]|uniref:hypothetical protein n=1 Tax=Vibrio alfacsensis TaxID=1074311 RepID=UPI002ADE440E|nr:hypothetical protein [Vibrio alfacsensis]WQE79456.1 hypothetical protein SO574_23580 [Vibrio alfacsensis]